jgi:hypothetical protein
MAGTKVIIAQADYKHLLAAVTLLAGDVDKTAETVGYVFSQLEELGIEVEAELEVDRPISAEDIHQYGVLNFGGSGFTNLTLTNADGSVIVSKPLAIKTETYDAVFEDPAVDIETVLLVIDTQPNVNRLVFHPDTPYKLVNAAKAKTNLECVVNDKIKTTEETPNIIFDSKFTLDNGVLTTHSADFGGVEITLLKDKVVKEIIFHPDTDPKVMSLVKFILQEDELATERLDKLLKSDGYAFNAKARVLIVYLSKVEDISLLLTHFSSQLKLCVIAEIVSNEDLSSLQFKFAEVKICCLNGIK